MIEEIKKQIAVLEAEANRPNIEPDARAYIQTQIANLKYEIKKYK